MAEVRVSAGREPHGNRPGLARDLGGNVKGG